ncbi:MAG TPA: hypothetical protein VMW65_03775 [Chloroflexota bacterium]|nr:hypothetical protein [Chloroflexota bacterium]
MGDITGTTLTEFVQYLPVVQALNLDTADLEAIRVRAEPPTDEDFLSFGDIPPGAPAIGKVVFPFVGTRQIYVARSDASRCLWNRLARALAPHSPSGSGGTGMFGNDAERFLDEENPELSWRRFRAGQQIPSGPIEM